jgi:hypothetical protein
MRILSGKLESLLGAKCVDGLGKRKPLQRGACKGFLIFELQVSTAPYAAKRAAMARRDHFRAFGSFMPPPLVPGPEAAREFTFSRSSVVVVVTVLGAGGAAAEDDA